MQARYSGTGILNSERKKKTCQPRILYPMIISFKNEGKIKIFHT